MTKRLTDQEIVLLDVFQWCISFRIRSLSLIATKKIIVPLQYYRQLDRLTEGHIIKVKNREALTNIQVILFFQPLKKVSSNSKPIQ